MHVHDDGFLADAISARLDEGEALDQAITHQPGDFDRPGIHQHRTVDCGTQKVVEWSHRRHPARMGVEAAATYGIANAAAATKEAPRWVISILQGRGLRRDA